LKSLAKNSKTKWFFLKFTLVKRITKIPNSFVATVQKFSPKKKNLLPATVDYWYTKLTLMTLFNIFKIISKEIKGT
jgi:hypothetical protein